MTKFLNIGRLRMWTISPFIFGINLELNNYRPTWLFFGWFIISIEPKHDETRRYVDDKYETISKHIHLHTEPLENKKFFNLGISIRKGFYALFIGRLFIN